MLGGLPPMPMPSKRRVDWINKWVHWQGTRGGLEHCIRECLKNEKHRDWFSDAKQRTTICFHHA